MVSLQVRFLVNAQILGFKMIGLGVVVGVILGLPIDFFFNFRAFATSEETRVFRTILSSLRFLALVSFPQHLITCTYNKGAFVELACIYMNLHKLIA